MTIADESPRWIDGAEAEVPKKASSNKGKPFWRVVDQTRINSVYRIPADKANYNTWGKLLVSNKAEYIAL